MDAQDVVTGILLAIGLVGELICVVGLLAARTALDKLHYTSAATSFPPWFFAAAVVVEKHGSSAGVNAIVIAVIMFVLGSVANHYAARVARNRELRG